MEFINEKEAAGQGMIRVDSDFGKKVGFTSDKFESDSYLWEDGKYIYISLITAKKQDQGYFSTLLDNIFKAGYSVKVPSPLGLMPEILKKRGFKPITESRGSLEFRECEVWIKENKKIS